MSGANLASTTLAVVAAVARSNEERSASGRRWGVAVLGTIGFAMVIHAWSVAVLVAWAAPEPWLAALPNGYRVDYACFYWLYLLLLIQFLASGIGGFVGWFGVCAVFVLLELVLVAVLVKAALSNRRKRRSRTATATSRDGSQPPPATVEGSCGSDTLRLRLHAMCRRYAPEKLAGIDAVLERGGKGCEAKLLAAMIARYGPEPPTIAPTIPKPCASFATGDYARRIEAMYRCYMPERLPTVPGVLQKAAGSEQRLLDALVKRYGPEPVENAPGSERTEVDHTARAPAAITTESEFRSRIVAMYKAYQPDKVGTVDATLAKYTGREKQLIAALVSKYGPEPTSSLSEPLIPRQLQQPTAQQQTSGQGTDRFARYPQIMERKQFLTFSLSLLAVAAIFGTLLLLVYGFWTPPPYRLVLRAESPLAAGLLPKTSPAHNLEGSGGGTSGGIADRPQLIAIDEPQSNLGAKALQTMYSWPGLASDMQLRLYVYIYTDYCARVYRQVLHSNASRRVEILDQFVDVYKVNMSAYSPQLWSEYTTVNDWLKRDIAPGARPIAAPTDAGIISSPTDGRLHIFSNAEAARFWVKGASFSVAELTDFATVDGDPDYFAGGSVMIARMTFEDYHHFHSPVSGRLISQRRVSGSYWALDAAAWQSDNAVFYNERVVLILDAGPLLKKVAVIAIGAACSGSIVPRFAEGDVVNRGEDLGFIQFGGSSVVLLFKFGTTLPDCDVLSHSVFGVETRVLMGERIARVADPETPSPATCAPT